MTLALDAAWVSGLLLAMIRVAGFVVASPLFPRSLPVVARAGVVIGLGLFLATPLAAEPDLAELLGSAVVNAAIGVALGFLTGLIFHLFAVAGGVVDFTSGLMTGSVLDPTSGEHASVFGRLFTLTALALFYVLGGLRLIAQGLTLSAQVIALDGGIAPHQGLADMAVRLTARLFMTGVEIALPAVASLFLIEVVLGIAARFAPQANIFLLGLPLKVLAALGTVGVVLMLFPEAMNGVIAVIQDTFRDGIGGLVAGPR